MREAGVLPRLFLSRHRLHECAYQERKAAFLDEAGVETGIRAPIWQAAY
jgi:hypothetical protein